MVIPLMLRCFQIVKSSYLIIYIRYLRYTSHVVGTECGIQRGRNPNWILPEGKAAGG